MERGNKNLVIPDAYGKVKEDLKPRTKNKVAKLREDRTSFLNS